MKKRIISFILVICLAVAAIPFGTAIVEKTAMTSSAAVTNYTAFQQNDLAWKDYDPSATYAAANGGSAKGCAIGPQGCGLMSLVNAIYYLNGNTIDIKQLSDWAYAGSAYGGGPNGTWTGSMRNVLYPNVASAFGARYGFKAVSGGGYGNASNATLKNHLANGGVAVGHVKSHFICLADYDAATDRILVLDSGADYDRRFTSQGGNWLSYSELSGDSAAMIVDWFYLFSSTTSNVVNYNVSSQVTSGSGSVFFGADLTSRKIGAGDNVFCRIVPSNGQKISSISVNGTSIAVKANGVAESYMFTMPSADAVVKVAFTSGGVVSTDSVLTSAATYDVNEAIIQRADTARPNTYVGMFKSTDTSYSIANSIFYYNTHAKWYFKDSSGYVSNGITYDMQSTLRGGKVANYGPGSFKLVMFDANGKVSGSNEAAFTLTGTMAHEASIKYIPDSNTTPDPSPDNTLYTVSTQVVSGQGVAHFGADVTTASVYAGTVINYQTTPAAGYKVSKITINGTDVAVQNNGEDCVYQFTMPAQTTVVQVTFTAAAYSKGLYKVTASSGVNVYSTAGGSTSLGTLAKDIRFTALEVTNTSWAKITYNGQTGYVSLSSNVSKVSDVVIPENDIIFDNSAAVNWVSSATKKATTISLSTDDTTGDTFMKLVASASNDPIINLDFSQVGSLNASAYKYMVVTARTTSANKKAKFYICAGSVTGATEDCTKSFNWTNDGLWHDYVIDLSAVSLYSGNMNTLRFDYFDGDTAANSTLDLRSIKFYTSAPSSVTITTDKSSYTYGSDIKLTYSGLGSHLGTQQNQLPFVAIYSTTTQPGAGGALIYTYVDAASGTVTFPKDAVQGVASSTTLPAGSYTAWIAYDATGTFGSSNLNNVHYAGTGASYNFTITDTTTTPTLYTITTSVKSGSGTSHFGLNVTSAQVTAGDLVNVDVAPASGYRVNKITVGGSELTIENNGGAYVYSFSMPAKSCSVDVYFVKISTDVIENIGNGSVSNKPSVVANSGATAADSIASIKSMLGATTVTITKNGTAVSGTTVIGTGMVVTADNTTYTVVVKGDVDGDGSINIADAANAMSALQGKSTLSDASRDAVSSYTGNKNNMNILDIMKLLNGI